ncbi:MAG: CRISPR-associated endonuclease Cas3'' [Pseudomonadota bacterium]
MGDIDMTDGPVAHVTNDSRRHALRDHLLGTAQKAGDFAAVFGFRQWGRLAGLWHDLGKYSKAFQDKLSAVSGSEAHIEDKARVDHSTAGGILAIDRFNKAGRLLAYIIAGHHAGLADWEADKYGNAALAIRLKNRHLLDAALSGGAPGDMLGKGLPSEKPVGRDAAFWVRMLFSCVVDADFLDTEEFFDPDKAYGRGGFPSMADLLSAFSAYMTEKISGAEKTDVNSARADVLDRCIGSAKRSPGIFSLTVPTGGGKTLSSMAFALHHASIYGHRRIIYVIPYTSIIEQTADQFRKIFGDAVIEHHSNLDVADAEKETPRSRLACENWDAPIIVTTSVQFFESLFASRTSRCRKLHNVAGSVVVLDEAQLLPPEFLNPILKALDELTRNYSVTVLLSTATQPALGPYKSPGFNFKGLEGIREIMESPAVLYERLRRVDVKLPDNIQEPATWEEIADELVKLPSVLCIVNRRDDCRCLWSLMPGGTVHLSALMCGAHRSRRIAEIKGRLDARLPVRVISTQLVEAGVDLDFPVVYRALAGLDSIAQAAGRCNREGRLERGSVVVFNPPSRPPVGILREAAGITAGLLRHCGNDPLAPELFESFFRKLYWGYGDERLDGRNILADLKADSDFRFSFRNAASKFKIIDDTRQEQVLVRYGEEGEKLIDQLIRKGPERWLLRRLQRYVVNLPKGEHDRLRRDGAIHEAHEGIFIQWHGNLYDDNLGFCADRSMIYNPDDLIG